MFSGDTLIPKFDAFRHKPGCLIAHRFFAAARDPELSIDYSVPGESGLGRQVF